MADHAGQPTKYRKEFCDWLIEHMSQGYSLESFVGALFKRGVRISRQSFYNWANKEHDSYQPDWAETLEIAKDCSLFWWETVGKDGLHGMSDLNSDGKTIIRPLNTGVWALNMRNRFGYKDKIEVTTQGGDKPQKLVIQMSDDDEESAE